MYEKHVLTEIASKIYLYTKLMNKVSEGSKKNNAGFISALRAKRNKKVWV